MRNEIKKENYASRQIVERRLKNHNKTESELNVAVEITYPCFCYGKYRELGSLDFITLVRPCGFLE